MQSRSYENITPKRILVWVMFVLMLAAIAAKLYLIYLPMFVFGHIVPPGGDAANHAIFIQNIIQGKFDMGYPWLFHVFAAAVSKVIAQPPLQTLRIISPALTVLPAVGVYIFCRRLFGQVSAWMGFFLCLMVSSYALLAYVDGNYPNLIAAGFLLPLVLLYLVKSLEQRRVTNYVWMILLACLLVLSHHLSAVYLLLISVAFLLTVGILRVFEKIAPNYWRVVTVALITAALLTFIMIVSGTGHIFSSAFNSIKESGGFLMGSQWSKPIDFSLYGPQIGPLIFYGGLFSILYILYRVSLNKDVEERKLGLILILVWFGVLFIFSRLEQTGLPGRFTRELALPLIVAQAVFFSDVLNKIRTVPAKLFALGFMAVIFWVNLSQLNNGEFRSPEFFNRMVWFDQEDQFKTKEINAIVGAGKTVLTNETNPNLRFFLNSRLVNDGLSSIKSGSMIKDAVAKNKADYLLISSGLNANYMSYIGESSRLDFQKNRQAIEEFMPPYKMIHEVGGLKLYCVECARQKLN